MFQTYQLVSSEQRIMSFHDAFIHVTKKISLKVKTFFLRTKVPAQRNNKTKYPTLNKYGLNILRQLQQGITLS